MSNADVDTDVEKFGLRRLSRRLSFTLILFVMVVGFLSLVGEVSVRLLAPQHYAITTPGLGEMGDPPRLTPGFRGRYTNGTEFDTELSVNAFGLRGPELDPASSGGPRLLVIGDSFTFGIGVEAEETFVAQVKEELREVAPGLETFNGGVPGFSPLEELSWLKTYGLQLNPDVVVIAIFLGNDIIEATKWGRSPIEEGGIGAGGQLLFASTNSVPETGGATGTHLWLFHNSHLVRLVSRFAPTGVRRLLGFGESWVTNGMRRAFRSHNPSDPLTQEGMAANREALTELAELAREESFRLAALVIPSDMQLDQDRWNIGMMLAKWDPEDYDFDPQYPGRFFGDLLAELDIPMVDLSPIIKENLYEDEPLYYVYDPHWTPAGHRLAAGALAELLIEHGLLQEPTAEAEKGDSS